MKFELPKDENGKLYWIPVVVKNKDYLLGFIDAYRLVSTLYDVPLSELSKMISSDRFNDVLYDNSRASELTKEQLKEKVKEILLQPQRSEHVENFSELYEENVLTIDCPHCGMFYSFKELEEIPDQTTKCQVCGKTIIFYTGIDDNEIEYEGKHDSIESVVNDIHKDLFGGNE